MKVKCLFKTPPTYGSPGMIAQMITITLADKDLQKRLMRQKPKVLIMSSPESKGYELLVANQLISLQNPVVIEGEDRELAYSHDMYVPVYC